jgi:hypothetical protein
MTKPSPHTSAGTPSPPPLIRDSTHLVIVAEMLGHARLRPSRLSTCCPPTVASGDVAITRSGRYPTDTTYLGARYQRLVPRLGKKKAIVALEHSILIAVWHMLTHDVDYHDLGADYFARLGPDHALRRIIRQANTLATSCASTPSRLPDPSHPPLQQVPISS